MTSVRKTVSIEHMVIEIISVATRAVTCFYLFNRKQLEFNILVAKKGGKCVANSSFNSKNNYYNSLKQKQLY